MSRIFGYWDGYSTVRSDVDSPIRAAMQTSACDRFAAWDLNPGSLFWAGWRAPTAIASKNCIAVVDGTFYDCPRRDDNLSDAECLIDLYREFGFRRAISLVNGDFAVALYDTQSQTWWLARDRFGAKPLFYVADSTQLIFASRLRALTAMPGVSTTPNASFVATFAGLHYRYFDNRPDESPFADIAQLPAATILKYDHGQLQMEKYWQLSENPNWEKEESELAEEYRDRLLNAVQIRLNASEKPGFTLSGGMDSSSVLSSAVHVSGQKQQALSTVYEDKTYDESDDIATILEETVSTWHQVNVDNPNVFDQVSAMVRVNDEPVATATWLSHFQLCDTAAERGFKSLFGGLGGDELNAGEYEYFIFHFADLKQANQTDQLHREIELWSQYHDHPIYRKSLQSATNDIDRLVDLEQPGICRLDSTRFERYLAAIDSDYRSNVPREPVMEHPFSSYLKNRTYQDMTRETAPCCLRAEDRHAAEFGLENFLPFFDHQLVEFMFRIPGEMKIRNGITKHLMRHATKGILPDSTRNRIKKTGWNAPAHQWFSGDGSIPLRDLVQSRSFRERGIYDVPVVERLLNEHVDIVDSNQIRENHMMFFWQLVNLELWLESLESSSLTAGDVFEQKKVA